MPIAYLSALLLLLGAFSAAELPAASGAEPAGPLAQEMADTRCSMKPEPGPCKALFERYYYEKKSKACRPFFWGGCDGAVPFETMAECEQACLNPQTLRMQDLKPLRGDVYAEVSLEFPKTWERPDFLVEVDGREVAARPRSGGFSLDRQMESLVFFPGRPGRKRVTVTATTEGRRVEAAGQAATDPDGPGRRPRPGPGKTRHHAGAGQRRGDNPYLQWNGGAARIVRRACEAPPVRAELGQRQKYTHGAGLGA